MYQDKHTISASAAFLSLVNQGTGVKVADKSAAGLALKASQALSGSSYIPTMQSIPPAAESNANAKANMTVKTKSSVAKKDVNAANKVNEKPTSQTEQQPTETKQDGGGASKKGSKVTAKTDSAFKTVALHRARPPLVLADLQDEEEEGVYGELEIDLYSEADLTWSDEAPSLKKLYNQKLHEQRQAHIRTEAEIRRQKREHSLRTAGNYDRISTLHNPNTTTASIPEEESVSFSEDFVFGYFETLRLVDKDIGVIDERFKSLEKLKELSLTGNFLTHVDVQNLPPAIEILHLNGNWLTSCPDISKFQHLVHLGLGYNSIKSLREIDNTNSTATSSWLPPSLISFDITANDLVELQETVDTLSKLSTLKILCLLKNPLALHKDYRRTVVTNIKSLILLDDIAVSHSELKAVHPSELQEPTEEPEVHILIEFREMTGLQQPIIPPSETDKPPDEITYVLEAIIESYNSFKITTSPFVWSEEMIDVNSANQIILPISKAVRDAFKETLTIHLLQQTHTHIPIIPPTLDPATAAPGDAKSPSRPQSGKAGAGAPTAKAAPAAAAKKPAAPEKGGKKPPPGKGGKKGGSKNDADEG
ncbi:Leucine-rich repeat-containing protein 43 [Blyttiomyces sp. JEL0837]|nr:Leucine-rich repeat-containing protein 43 [Blyttiomyces sp. JEL0837]